MLPFVKLFYGTPSSFLWEDDSGTVHSVRQGEGGVQRNALMPLLFSMGQHRALQAAQEQLRQQERLMVFLDDVYTVSQPKRVGCVVCCRPSGTFRPRWDQGAWRKDQDVEHGWGRPASCDVLGQIVREENQRAVVWRGSELDS